MGVHNDQRLQDFFRSDCQRRWEEREGKGHDEFRAVFYESYI
jgi:hypothetical protein